MAYYFSKTLETRDFSEATELVTNALKEQGFGVLTKIDMQATLKEKMGVEMKPYTILGACNPPFAHKAVTAENNIGVFLPCNVVVRMQENGSIEVAAVDPVASMAAVNNDALQPIANEVQSRMKAVVETL